MKIQVTAEHIEKGQGGGCCSCPVWQAVTSALGISSVIVWANTVAIGENRDVYDLPKIARDSIAAFDGCGQMQPFEFELPIEVPTL